MNEIVEIQNQIFTIRGLQVMLDKDLAIMYQVETKVLNQAVKRNIARFPAAFRFQLNEMELGNLKSQNVNLSSRSQIVTLNNSERGKNVKYMPYVFTEQGVAMLSAILRSDIAIQVSVQIMNAFVEMRKRIHNNSLLVQRIENIEQKQQLVDQQFEQIFTALEQNQLPPKQGIFYDGQVFDAYVFMADIIKAATKSIVLIDNYIDETTLLLFSKRRPHLHCMMYTQNLTQILQLDVQKHNSQYPKIEIQSFKKAHDRFLIIDEQTVYHIGASLKDLGKKWFAFSKMEMPATELLTQIRNNKL